MFKVKCSFIPYFVVVVVFYNFQLTEGVEMGPMLLFTGYRSRECDLYVKEKANMVNLGVLDFAFLALSRDPVIPRVS